MDYWIDDNSVYRKSESFTSVQLIVNNKCQEQ